VTGCQHLRGILNSSLLGAVCAVLFASITVPANAAFTGRLETSPGSGIFQAYYDDQLDITWAADANINGPDNWDNQVAWAGGLTIGGVSGWRLPSEDVNGDGTIEDCYSGGVGCADHEMGFLFWEEGITAAEPGPFSNVHPSAYWSGTESASNPANARVVSFAWGTMDQLNKNDYNLIAWAVHSGDVAADDDERYAVIIEGALTSPGSSDELGADKTARRVYQSLLGQGFTDDRIFYFSQDSQRAGVDALSTLANIDQYLISTTSGDGIDSLLEKATAIPGSIHMFLVGPGNSAGSFFLNPTDVTGDPGEMLGSAQIDSWLDVLEADPEIQSLPRTVIIASPYSGTMIAGLSGASNPSGRIIITSSAIDGSAVKGPEEQDGIAAASFFMEELMYEWERGIDLRQSFLTARDKTRVISRKDDSSLTAALQYVDNHLQRPQLDDNGDGSGTHYLQSTAIVSIPPVDGVLAQTVYLKPDGLVNPIEFEVSETISLPGPGFSCLSVTFPTAAFSWSVAIRSPGTTLSAGGNSTQIDLGYTRMNMATVPPYQVCPNFTQSGKYEVWYWGEIQGSGKSTPVKRSVVYVDDSQENQAPEFDVPPGAPVLLHPTVDGGFLPTNLITFDWESGTDSDGDAVTYTLLISDSGLLDSDGVLQSPIFKAEELGASILSPQISLTPDEDYFWQVQVVDPFGTYSVSFFAEFKAMQPLFAAARMGGVVTTGGTVGLEGATITWIPGDNSLEAPDPATSDSSGAFVFLGGIPVEGDLSARGILMATKTRYVADPLAVECSDCESQAVDMRLDTDGDGEPDDTDLDDDGDSLSDVDEATYGSDPLNPDTDSDSIPDGFDNCLFEPNTDQRDTDGDGYGNLCDGDLNDDGSTNTLDLNLYKLAHRSAVGDANYDVDADFNGDGVINTLDLNIYKGLHRKVPGPSCCGLLF